ncbi:MAG: ABC transporter permease [Candidatus Izimaplasma sp.]|nr:ABC transporter permease [Candidatus Izimaplasma bacterium]
MKDKFKLLPKEEKRDIEETRKSLTYWEDVWRRLKNHKSSMFGLVGVILIVFVAIFGPFFSPYGYEDTFTDYINVPPRIDIYKITEEKYFYVSENRYLIESTENGTLGTRYNEVARDLINRVLYFSKPYKIKTEITSSTTYPAPTDLAENVFYSETWGIGLIDAEFATGDEFIDIAYIHPDSPLTSLSFEEADFELNDDYLLDNVTFINPSGDADAISSDEGAEFLIEQFDTNTKIIDIRVSSSDIVSVDYSLKLVEPSERPEGMEDVIYQIEYKGNEVSEVYDTVRNQNNFLGTDHLGRDVLTRIIFGARISLTVALVATLVNFFIGVVYGTVAGYVGGSVDNYMMRIVDIINSIPLVLYVILLSVVLNEVVIDFNLFGRHFTLFRGSGGLGTIIVALGFVYWVNMARLVRGQIIGLKRQEYVLAARTIGVSNIKIMTRHLVPNAMGPIIVSMTMMIPAAVFTEAFLSFIGLGVSAPQASWGTLANEALQAFRRYPYQLFYPSLAISITMLAFNFLGDGLRDALDPRLRQG